MGLSNDILSILSESAELDSVSLNEMEEELDDVEDIDDYIDEEDINKMYDHVDELDTEICYTEEMVPVIQVNDKYIVEQDMLIKYMRSNTCNEMEALDNICESNSIPIENTYVLIESEENLRQSLEEAKCTCKNTDDKCIKDKIKKKMKKAKKGLKNLKDNKLNIIKKKDK